MTPPRKWLDGGWFVSFSGVSLDPLNPKVDDIELEDIAHHLANICRFGGACPTFYSVASHSMYVADLLPPELAIEGLLHDAAEAYVGDMIKAIKRHCKDYQQIEDLWEVTVRTRFGLPAHPLPDVKALVKKADVAALLAERRDIFGDTREYDEIAAPGPHFCVDLPPADGKASFLRYAGLLGIK